MRAAPRLTLTVPHTFPRAEAFHATAGWFRAKLLDLCGTFLHVRGVTLFGGKEFEQFGTACRMFGWLIGIHRSGWSIFCESEGLPAGYFDEMLPGDMVLHFADASLADRAYLPPLTDPEARELVGPNVLTAAAVASRLQDAFDEYRKALGG